MNNLHASVYIAAIIKNKTRQNNLMTIVTNVALNHLYEHLKVIESISKTCLPSIESLRNIVESLSVGGTLFWCGNGGSSADNQICAELVGRFNIDREPIRSIALTTDTSVITCIANDYNYEDVFSRQLTGLAREEDVLVVIGTSGNSKNVLQALRKAKTMGVRTVALLGNDGGESKDISDISIVIPSSSTARIQEAHILIGHIMCDQIERGLNYA